MYSAWLPPGPASGPEWLGLDLCLPGGAQGPHASRNGPRPQCVLCVRNGPRWGAALWMRFLCQAPNSSGTLAAPGLFRNSLCWLRGIPDSSPASLAPRSSRIRSPRSHIASRAFHNTWPGTAQSLYCGSETRCASRAGSRSRARESGLIHATIRHGENGMYTQGRMRSN